MTDASFGVTSAFLKNYISYFCCSFLFIILCGTNQTIEAQKVRLRSQIAPNCSATSSTLKFSDLYGDGNIAVLGSFSCRGAFIFDVSNPDAPVLKSHYDPIRPGTTSTKEQFLEAIVVGNTAYFGSGNGGGVYIVNISNPSNPQLLGRVTSTNGNGHDSIHEILIEDGILYQNFNGTSNKIIKVINVRNPANPVFIRDINPQEIRWVHAYHVKNGILYTSGWGSGNTPGVNIGKTEMYDITRIETEAPQLLGVFDSGNNSHSNWTYEGVDWATSAQTVSNQNGFAEFTFNIGANENLQGRRRFGLAPQRVDEYTKVPFAIGIGKNASGQYTAEVLEKNQAKFSISASNGDVFRIALNNNAVTYLKNGTVFYTSQSSATAPLFAKAYIYDRNTSVNNAKFSSNGSPGQDISWSDSYKNLVVNGNGVTKTAGCDGCRYLYNCRELLDGDLRVYNISNFASPQLVRTIKAADLSLNAICPHNPVLDDKTGQLFVSWYQAGVQVFDVTQPENPKRVAQYDTFQPQFSEELARETSLRAEPWDTLCGGEKMLNALPTNYDGNWAVFPFLGIDKVLIGDLASGLFILDSRQATAATPRNLVADFDGDNKTDLAHFRNGVWLGELSNGGTFGGYQFGLADDKALNGDFDGDGKNDYAVYRPSNGTWYLQQSNAGFRAVQFGNSTDIPVPADFDGDGKTDIAVFRNGTWYVLQSTLGARIFQWGTAGDKPVVGDYEGDGKPDFAVFRPSNGVWYIVQSSSSFFTGIQWGLSSDKPVVGDFDGDGKNDAAVYRPSVGIWYILNSANNSLTSKQWGISTDIPVSADYDGDGKTDIAVFRPGDGNFYRINSSNGAVAIRNFGTTGDLPIAATVNPQ